MDKYFITQEEKDKLEIIYERFLNNHLIEKMKEISMHRGSNTYIHCFLVAKRSIKKAIKKKKKINFEALLVGAILHDYYLYDWRKDRALLKKHGSKHPFVARDNAIRDFGISSEVCDIIVSHMWPFNFKLYPRTIEAKIVAKSDNVIAFKEFLTSIKYKQKHQDERLKYISKLF